MLFCSRVVKLSFCVMADNFLYIAEISGGRLSKLCFLSVVDVDGQQVYTDDNAAVAVYDSFCDYILN